jgi:hypothetical protein
MAAAATIPVFDPQGVLRDVPADQVTNAVKNGGVPAVKFQAPDQSIRFVPATRSQEAYQAGGKIIPIEDQPIQHPSFWHALAGDVWGAVKGAVNAGPEAGDYNALQADVRYQQKLQQEGHSAPYRALMSLTPSFMRDRAEAGDVTGVASAAGTLAATAAASPLASEVSVPSISSEIPARVVKTAGKTALDVATDIPLLRKLGTLKGNWDATAPKPTFPESPLAPEAPAPEVLQAASLYRGARPVQDPSAGLRLSDGMPGLWQTSPTRISGLSRRLSLANLWVVAIDRNKLAFPFSQPQAL